MSVACAWLLLCWQAQSLSMDLIHPVNQRGGPALHVRNALNEKQQRDMFAYICAGARETFEWRRLCAECDASERPAPLCVWNHPYTHECNVREAPTKIFDWTHSMAAYAARRLPPGEEALALSLEGARYDSMVSVLYAPGGSLRSHVDHGLEGLGAAVSLGAACDFTYGGTPVVLESGDLLWGAFGTVAHDVSNMRPAAATAPAWWLDLPTTPSGGEAVASFGRERCSIQIRRARRAP